MVVSSISNLYIVADILLDAIPFLSTLNNIIDLIAKAALRILAELSPSTYESLKDQVLVKHLDDKSVFVCVLLTIPFINLFVVLVRRYYSDDPPSLIDQEMEKYLRSITVGFAL